MHIWKTDSLSKYMNIYEEEKKQEREKFLLLTFNIMSVRRISIYENVRDLAGVRLYADENYLKTSTAERYEQIPMYITTVLCEM